MDSAIKYRLDSFEGPLDLLLQLISLNKVDINDIPIALILEQYMDVLAEMLENDLQNACDFVAMAAKLVYIKTKTLLPRPEKDEEEDPRAGLAQSLADYKRVREAAPYVSRRVQLGRDSLLRPPEALPKAQAVVYNIEPVKLQRAAAAVLERARRRLPPAPEQFERLIGAEPVPVEAKMAAILEELERRGSVIMGLLYKSAHSRSELVAVFLALLELISSRRAAIDGEGGEARLYESPEVVNG